CCAAIRHGISRDVVWQRVKDVGKTGERGWAYFAATWENAEAEVSREAAGNSDAPHHRNGRPNGETPPGELPEEGPALAVRLGELELMPTSARRTKARFTVCVDIRKRGRSVDEITLTTSASGKRDAALALQRQLDEEVDRATIDAA